jgi:23S rRNA pseudouridine2605 synthase
MEEQIRLAKYFTDCGVLSRRAAEEEIRRGNVAVNGHPASLGMKIDPVKDRVTYKGRPIQAPRNREMVYVMLNKPRGYATTVSDPHETKNILDLLTGLDTRVYPVGRLDKVSEGLLLFTNDGELANCLTHPKHAIPKIYRVKVSGSVSESQMDILTSPLVIDGYKIKPVDVIITGEDESGTVLKFTLFEGRNRQIRKMCEAAELTVKRLSRVSIGNLKLDGLPVGKWRYLEQSEVDYLYKATKEHK